MISWPSKPAPCVRPIGAERSAECAAIHATSFAYPWQEADFEQLFVASRTFADGAIEAKEEHLAGFVLSRAAAGEAEILTIAVAPQWRRRETGCRPREPHPGRPSGRLSRGLCPALHRPSRTDRGADRKACSQSGVAASAQYRRRRRRHAFHRGSARILAAQCRLDPARNRLIERLNARPNCEQRHTGRSNESWREHIHLGFPFLE